MAAQKGLIPYKTLKKNINTAMEKVGARGKPSYRIKVRAGDGLYVVVDHKGPRSWTLIVQSGTVRRSYGLGTYDKSMDLKAARAKALLYKTDIAAGLDPIARYKPQTAIPTFEEAARSAHAEIAPALKSKKHAAQWLTTLETYAFKKLGKIRVDKVTAPDVRGVLMAVDKDAEPIRGKRPPIWQTKRETAIRVRQRICAVMLWAEAEGHRDAPLSMAAVNKWLKPLKAIAPPKHRAAMKYDDVPAFMAHLATLNTVSATALRFTILTAARPGEARGATWDEIDMDERTWTVPASRMKMKKDHQVPLCGGALAALTNAAQFRHAGSDLVFPGKVPTKPISDMTMTKLIRDMDLEDAPTVHGFRSTFKDWSLEETEVQDHISEQALAHAIPDGTRRAYARSKLFKKRITLMDMWGAHCIPVDGGENVVAFPDKNKAG